MANFSKSHVPQFTAEVYQNEYLPEGASEVNAIVTVTSTGGGTTGRQPGPSGSSAAVVIMVDCSGSMDYPPTKMRNARDATAAAIDTIRDGVAFAVVAGMLSRTEFRTLSGMPAVGRVPLLGNAVADESNEHDRSELLVIITPRIVSAAPRGDTPLISVPKT